MNSEGGPWRSFIVTRSHRVPIGHRTLQAPSHRVRGRMHTHPCPSLDGGFPSPLQVGGRGLGA